MNPKLSLSIRSIVFGLSILLVAAGQAMAATQDLGSLAAPSSLTFGDTFSQPQTQFYDDYMFSIPDASVNSITSTIDLGSYLGINNLQSRLYSGTVTTTGVPSGLLEAWSTPVPINSGGVTGTLAIMSPITLGAGNYILEIRGDVVGTAGGSYAGVLNVSAVPEFAEWALLLTGMIMVVLFAARLRRKDAGEASGMYGIYGEGARVIDSFIHALSWGETLKRIAGWAKARESRYVCLCNVHSVVTARQDAEFKSVLRHADMVTPDGMPIAWMLRKLGFSAQERINGPDLMWKYCAQAAGGEAVYFYGSSFETLRCMSARLHAAFPGLNIAGIYAPPFRDDAALEEDAIIAAINGSGAGVVFVGLGCPKQEKWMAAHSKRLHAVMIGVGAAFAYYAGTVKRAPRWMQRCGLEWLHRLCSEPRRLWKRYLVTNTIFLMAAGMQLLQHAWGAAPRMGKVFSTANSNS
jgi:N-acetylglucosaminyldiphosphoundecaprenol N-acetyl-beta-D-mannosaminyltransferase